MDYSFNYNYLSQFMRSHNLVKKDILEALGSNDYTSLNKWLDGKIPVHITALLRICNYYNIPLCNFFCDEDGMPCDFAPLMPDKTAQLLPTDNYGIKEGRGRGIVETRIQVRKITSAEQTRAVAEGLAIQAEQRNKRDLALTQMVANEIEDEFGHDRERANTQDGSAITETILRLKLDHSDELRRMEQSFREKEDAIRERHDREKDRLMSIIEMQAGEIARLSSPRHLSSYNNGDNNNISMVAEGPVDCDQRQ